MFVFPGVVNQLFTIESQFVALIWILLNSSWNKTGSLLERVPVMSVFAFLLASIACFDQYIMSCMCVNWSNPQEQTGGRRVH